MSEEKSLLSVVEKFGSKKVAGALARRFQDKNFSDEVVGKLGVANMADEKAVLPDLQKKAGIFGALLDFVKAVEEVGLAQKTGELESSIKPSEEVVAVFRKIGEEMTTTSGAKPVSEDIEHLESILHRKREVVEAEEFALAQGYIDGIKIQVLALNAVKDGLAKKFEGLNNAEKKIKMGDVFRSRIEEFRKVFVVSDSDSQITLKSTMTGNLGDVIPHIRQCLGCTSKECNNDTNLTFGDRNRFSVIVREFGMPESKSIADELVTVQVTEDKGGKVAEAAEAAEAVEADETSKAGEVDRGSAEKRGYSFVMDNVYGQRSRDVLVCNVLTVLSKLKGLAGLSPDTKIDIFVTDSALSSCGLTIGYLKEKLEAEVEGVKLERVTKEVHIAQSASGDGHYEIGGSFGGRVFKGSGEVGGIKVSI